MATAHLPIHCDPEIKSGTPVFVGTRVPAQTLRNILTESQRVRYDENLKVRTLEEAEAKRQREEAFYTV